MTVNIRKRATRIVGDTNYYKFDWGVAYPTVFFSIDHPLRARGWFNLLSAFAIEVKQVRYLPLIKQRTGFLFEEPFLITMTGSKLKKCVDATEKYEMIAQDHIKSWLGPDSNSRSPLCPLP